MAQIRIPPKVEVNTRIAFQDIDGRLKDLETALGDKIDSLTLKKVEDAVTQILNEPGPASPEDFTASGPGHQHGLVPDPGVSAASENVLHENAVWQKALQGLVDIYNASGAELTQGSDIVQILANLVVTGKLAVGGMDVAGDSTITGALAVSTTLTVTGVSTLTGGITPGTLVGLTENHGGLICDPNGFSFTAPRHFIVWVAPYSCTVTAVKGIRVGGSAASINAYKNSTSSHLSSNLSLSSASTLTDGGAVQNTGYVAGDWLSIYVASYTGATDIFITVYFTRA